MTVTRRTRTRVVAEPEPTVSRSTIALRRRRGQTDEQVPNSGRRAGVCDKDQQVVSAPNTDYPLTEILDKASYDMRPARPGPYLHVSDLLHKCIRKKALEERYDAMPAQQRLTMSDMLTFSMGDAVHDTLKARARVGRPDIVWGIWSCKCSFLKHEEPCTYAEIDQEETCPHCNSVVDQYHEVSMRDDEYGIVGNPDLILYFARKDALHVTELKSMAHKGWEELVRPVPEHVIQVVFYWHLMHRKGYRLTDKVSILYCTKQWQFGNKTPFKEFLIDPVASLDRLDQYIEDAKAYKAAQTGGELPLRTFCSHESAKGAKSCGVLQLCFGE